MSSQPSKTTTPVRLTMAGAADAVTAAHWRHALRRWLQQKVQASTEIRDGVVLGVNEALTNCVEHAYQAHERVGTMKLQASYDPSARSLRVCVSDRGTWQRPSLVKSTDPRVLCGITLMHTLADHCTISARPNGTSVYLDYATRTDSTAQQHLSSSG